MPGPEDIETSPSPDREIDHDMPGANDEETPFRHSQIDQDMPGAEAEGTLTRRGNDMDQDLPGTEGNELLNGADREMGRVTPEPNVSGRSNVADGDLDVQMSVPRLSKAGECLPLVNTSFLKHCLRCSTTLFSRTWFQETICFWPSEKMFAFLHIQKAVF